LPARKNLLYEYRTPENRRHDAAGEPYAELGSSVEQVAGLDAQFPKIIPMNASTPSRAKLVSVLAVIGLLLSVAIQVAVMLAEAGYQAAFGGVDSAGHVLGFNEPVKWGHVGLMARSLAASEILQALNILNGVMLAVTLLPLFQFAAAGGWRIGLRLIRGHSVLFAVSWVAWMSWHWATSHPFTGECIVEGELSFAALALVWIAAWLPVVGFAMARRLLSLPKLTAFSPARP
jgi:hypothetical protein